MADQKPNRGFFSSFIPHHGNGGGRSAAAATLEWAAEQRRAMVETQLRRRGIRDQRVLEAMLQVPRHEFVPPQLLREAYEDHPLPIGGGQTISQPYMVAAMIEALALRGPDQEKERVLEVGTGSGYEAAVLARLAAEVYTIEYDAGLARTARDRLAHMGFGNITVVEGDGSLGYLPAAPYHGILVAAAAPEVPERLFEQLTEGGRLVIPVGGRDWQELRLIRKLDGRPVITRLGQCRFVPLLGAYGWDQQ
jgi:protein-L-isoaspartate(D-aspartate) O-methyltransferase